MFFTIRLRCFKYNAVNDYVYCFYVRLTSDYHLTL